MRVTVPNRRIFQKRRGAESPAPQSVLILIASAKNSYFARLLANAKASTATATIAATADGSGT